MNPRLHRAFSGLAIIVLLTAPLRAWADPAPRPAIERLADLPTPVAGGGLLSLADGRLVYAGGTTWIDGVKHWLTDAVIYDPATNRWEPGPPLPEPADATVPLSLRIDDRWVLLGGETDEGVSNHAVALVDDAEGLRWESMPPLPFRKAAASGGVVGDTLIVVGGADDGDSYAVGDTTVWAGRNSDASRAPLAWTRLGDFPGRGHSVAAGAAYAGRLYVFGGLYGADGAALNTDEAMSFSPEDGWRTLRPIPVACRGATAVGVEAIGIVLAGGWSDAGPLDDVYLYQPESDTYEHIGTLPAPVAVASGVVIGRNVYLAGNEDKARSRRSDFFRLRFPPAQPTPPAAPRHAED